MLPEPFIIALVLITGLVVGSFVTLASYRIPRDLPIGAGRSRCASCGTNLGLAALVPVLSWIFQKGRCRYCRAPISIRYPLTECLQALLFLAVYSVYDLTLPALFLTLMTVCLMLMIVVDIEWQIIPDEVQIAMLLFGSAFHGVSGTPVSSVFSGFASGALLGLVLYYGYGWLRKREMLGFGDVKFLMIAGIWMASVEAWPPFLFYAGLLGIVTGLLWKLLKKGEHFPFGPALAAALLLMLLTPSGVVFFAILSSFYR
jgi:prepilin signal peptidase PulO-like enzyme (type II secretory pathway)